MKRGSGLRHGSIVATLRPSPHAVSARPGDDPRLGHHPRTGTPPLHAFSPFVPLRNDSESGHADPSGTSLALSDRLARDQQDRALHARGRTLRALPTPTRPPGRPTRRRRWCVVGRRYLYLARWPWSPDPASTRVHRARRDPHDTQAGLSRDRPPQPRPDVQRAAMAQPRRSLPALPHDPRRARASTPPLVECVPKSRPRRPLFRSIQLGAAPSGKARRDGPFPRAGPACGSLLPTDSPRR